MLPFDPYEERSRRTGREGYVQYLLTALVLGARPPGYNRGVSPSATGTVLLQELDRCAFGTPDLRTPEFVWEFELPGRTPDERSGWPDLAAIWPDRVLLFELKTEPGSVREGQVDWYIDLALFDHPQRRIDFLYLTTQQITTAPQNLSERARYRNVTWEVVNDIIERWANGAGDGGRAIAAALIDVVQNELYGSRPAPVPAATPSRPLPTRRATLRPFEAAVEVAQLVEADKEQRAVNYAFSSFETAQMFRRELLDAIADLDFEHALDLAVARLLHQVPLDGCPVRLPNEAIPHVLAAPTA